MVKTNEKSINEGNKNDKTNHCKTYSHIHITI